MDTETWRKEYQRLCTAYGRTASVEQAGIYFEALSRYENEEIVRGVREALTRCKYFPTVADIIVCVGSATSDESDPLYPQFRKWREVNANDPQMPSITFGMFRNFVEGQRAS